MHKNKCLTVSVIGSPDTMYIAKNCISSIPKILKIVISKGKANQNKEILYLRTWQGKAQHCKWGKVYNVPFTPLSVTMAKLLLPHMPAKQQAS